MDLNIVDEVVSHTPTKTGGAGAPARRVVNETITLGSGASAARPDAPPAGAEDDQIRLGVSRGRSLSTAAQRMLANIDKHGTVVDDAPSGTSAADKPTGEETDKTAEASQDNKPAAAAQETPKQPDAPDPTAEHRAANERLTARNRELVAEVEKLRGAAAPAREPSAREKTLDEIERAYLDDPIGSIRRFQALVLGVDDPKHADVDAEMQGFYQDLTVEELGVSLDESKQAKREAARTRQLLARQKREQTAASEAASKPKDDPKASETAQMHSLIGNRLSFKRSDGKSIADQFPLLTQFASDMTGHKPEAILWDGIRHAISSGELTWDSKADVDRENDRLIETVAKQLETRFQDLADRIGKARQPAPSTATPTPAADATAQNATGNSHGTRTITNASASVAPATPPATKTEQPKPDSKPTYRNEKERRLALARRFAGET